MRRCVRRRIVTSEERRGVDFTFGGGKIVLAGHGAELGESHVELPIAYDGADIGITLDPAVPERFSQGAGPRADVYDGAARRGERRGLQHGRRLRLCDHAAGAGAVDG